MIRLCSVVVVALLAAPAFAQVTIDAPPRAGVYLARDASGALHVVGQPDPSMPSALSAEADTAESRNRWASARRGARTGALVGAAIGAGLIAVGAYADLSGTTTNNFIPYTLVAAAVALPVVGTSALVGGGVGYATGGD